MNLIENTKLLGTELNIVGIIGKNGKSTIGQMVHHCHLALKADSNSKISTEILNEMLPQNYEKIAKNVIMEVALHSIKEKKASYIDFDNLIFTNSSKNIDTDELWTMMRPFIALPIEKTAIINIDDEHGINFCDMTVAKTLTYGLNKTADINARNIKLAINKTKFDLYHKENFICKTKIPYFGIYNIYNALATIAHFTANDYNPAKIAQLLENLPQTEGRFDTFSTNTGIKVIIDYARTPEAVDAVLKSLATIGQKNIITVIGADGNTNTAGRIAIGKSVLTHSQKVILTTDNPRSEEPQSIIYDMIKHNIKQNYRICIDREKAIEIALKAAKPKDIVIILGKGHEKTQIIGKKTSVFCDKKTAKYLAHKLEI